MPRTEGDGRPILELAAKSDYRVIVKLLLEQRVSEAGVGERTAQTHDVHEVSLDYSRCTREIRIWGSQRDSTGKRGRKLGEKLEHYLLF